MSHINAAVQDSFIWARNKNGNYTTKSGYDWLLSLKETDDVSTPHRSWSWIWKLHAPEKIKFFIWLIFHNAAPTLSLLHHRNMAASAICPRCGEDDETILHCIRDCHFSKSIWINVGFADNGFFAAQNVLDWINLAASGPRCPLFLAGIWWVWRYRNLMCLNNESWSLFRITNNICHSAESISLSFQKDGSATHQERFVRWNCNNHMGTILNVDGSCLGTPIRTGFGGIIRNTHGFYLAGFSGYINNSNDILFAELTAIYRGLRLAINMGLNDLICYSDSLISINLINVSTPSYHTYAVLIQDIKDLLHDSNFTLHHTLREGNHSADFMAKLGASSAEDFILYSSPPADLLPLLKIDASGTSFPRP